MSIIPEIERQLHDAAERRAQSPVTRALARTRRWRGLLLARPLMIGLAVVAGGAGVALAARALVEVGNPAPREYPNLGEKILPEGTRLLSLRVPDPAGGPPWGMRLIFTAAHGRGDSRDGGTAHWGCVQIGRVLDGKLGVLGQDGAFHNDGRFHELPVQPEACGSLNRAGQLAGITGESNIQTASAYQGLKGCLTEAMRTNQALALPTIRRQLAIAKAENDPQGIRSALQGLAYTRRIDSQLNAEPSCPSADDRRISYGIAGPHSRSITVTRQGLNETIALNPSDDGAYLIVQRASPLHIPTLGAHRSAPRPGIEPAPETPLSRRAERDPSTPNPVTLTPSTGGPHTTFNLAFRALLNGGGYSYLIRTDGPPRCQREAERATRGDGVAIGRTPIARGQTITKTLKPPPHGLCPGSYRIYVAFSNPEASSLPNFPFATVHFVVTP
jgi:hypothetical protein